MHAQTIKGLSKKTFPVSIAIAMLSTLAGCHAKEPQTADTTIVFATRDIPLAEIIGLTDLEERKVNADSVPANAVHRSDLVSGRYSRGIKRGQAITSRYIVPAGGLLNEILPSVVYASAPISAGCYISPDAIEEKPMALEKIPSNVYECNKKTFANSYAKSDINKGAMLSFASFIPEAGRHYIFTRHDVKPGVVLSRADIRIEDPPYPNQALTLSVERLLEMKLKRAIRKGQQISINDLY